MIAPVFAIVSGAALGALLRWVLSIQLNAWFPAIPPGTWVANMLGGYLMGVALALFSRHTELSPALQWFLMTGFLGSLTTFSTFSAEVMALLQQGRLLMAMLAISLHVAGSLLMTFLGLLSVALFKG